MLDLAGDNTELAMTSAKLASASTSGTNLVSSWWDRESSIALPLFLAICAIARTSCSRSLTTSANGGRAPETW